MTDDPQPAAIQLLVPGIELPARGRGCGRCREEIGRVDRPRHTVATDGGVQHDVTGFGERLGGPVPQPDVLGCLREREARVADEQHTRIRPRAGVARAEERRRPRVPVMIGVGDPLVTTTRACPPARRPERITDERAFARVRVRGLGRGHGRVLLEDAQPLGRAPLVVEIRRVPLGGPRCGVAEPGGALRARRRQPRSPRAAAGTPAAVITATSSIAIHTERPRRTTAAATPVPAEVMRPLPTPDSFRGGFRSSKVAAQ